MFPETVELLYSMALVGIICVFKGGISSINCGSGIFGWNWEKYSGPCEQRSERNFQELNFCLRVKEP
jgi:hypothetical protein